MQLKSAPLKTLFYTAFALCLLNACSEDPFPKGDFTCTCVRTGNFSTDSDTTFITQYNGVTKEHAEYNCQHSSLDYQAADINFKVDCTIE